MKPTTTVQKRANAILLMMLTAAVMPSCQSEEERVEGEKRYSPATCKGVKETPVMGRPDPDHISTSYVERHNLTMRMSMRRFTRLTNAFSKKLRNHAAALALYFGWYNFCRIHKTLRVTPAMEAGLATMPRDAEWIVELVDAAAPKPAKPGPKPGLKPSRARI